MSKRTLVIVPMLALALIVAGCGQAPAATPAAAPTADPAAAPAPDAPAAPTAAPAAQPAPAADLSGVKTYLLGQADALTAATADLQAASDRYYALAEAAGFDYAALWSSRKDAAVAEIEAARDAWMRASPAYEKMEGIVAGTPALAQFDVDMDAGASAEEDPQGAVSFDLQLPDGRTLPRPGNLFGVTESTLWGTDPDFTAAAQADWDGDGMVEFGEALPDANVLKGGADTLHRYAGELRAAAQAWTPSESDAFTALVVMVPTMSEYFGSWRDSRFVTGESSTQRDFVAISRLADIQDILGGLEVVYGEVTPLVQGVDAAQGEQIGRSLADLKQFVAQVYTEEQAGKRFSVEEADTLGAEAQNRATAITGQITQVAAQLGVPIQE
jgi:hypothetical protein